MTKSKETLQESLFKSKQEHNAENQMKISHTKKNKEYNNSEIKTGNKRKSTWLKHLSTYDPNIFNVSQFEPRGGRFNPANAEPIKLVVTLKDIGLEGLDSYKSETTKEIEPQSPPKTKIKEKTKKNSEDIEKLNEQRRMKRIQEDWDQKKRVEKQINTYDPKIFYTSHYSPRDEIRPDFIPPIKLNVKLEDIGLEGLDSYKPETTKEKEPQSPPITKTYKKVKTENSEDIEKLNEKMRMKKIQEEWEKKKKKEKEINTYDPQIFYTSHHSPRDEIRPDFIPPIKLNVKLEDIGLEGLDSYDTKDGQEYRPNSPTKSVTKKSNIRKKAKKNSVKKQEKVPKKSSYDPSVFETSSCAFLSAKLRAQPKPPIKLSVTLKDIGLEGLDSI
ncbi:hypothetical protein M9Y10_007394 [Tritrichomonas musculus]|uniref:Uncharacterized protein n=1 Tax=Tritrichomonas musculus TaxID=1915356 RepID=A0ABR2J340_9EUKA